MVVWVVVVVLGVAAVVCGLLSVYYCFGRTAALVLVGMSLTVLVLVVGSRLLHP